MYGFPWFWDPFFLFFIGPVPWQYTALSWEPSSQILLMFTNIGNWWEHLDSSQLASPQVASCSKLHTFWAFTISSLVMRKVPHQLFELGCIFSQNHVPLLESRRSISFLFITSSGKYFPINTLLKVSQVTAWPSASKHWWVFSHQYSASSTRVYVPKATFYPSKHGISRKIFSISCI